MIEKSGSNPLLTPVPEVVMNDSEEVQRLIRLKRYESPGDEYFKRFREEFKDRQRAELLHRSARSLLAERVSMWFTEYNGGRWLIPVGATAALVAGGFYFAGSSVKSNAVAHRGIADSKNPPAISAGIPSSKENEVISLQLPRANNRVPGTASGAISEAQGLLPVGSKGTLREL